MPLVAIGRKIDTPLQANGRNPKKVPFPGASSRMPICWVPSVNQGRRGHLQRVCSPTQLAPKSSPLLSPPSFPGGRRRRTCRRPPRRLRRWRCRWSPGSGSSPEPHERQTMCKAEESSGKLKTRLLQRRNYQQEERRFKQFGRRRVLLIAKNQISPRPSMSAMLLFMGPKLGPAVCVNIRNSCYFEM